MQEVWIDHISKSMYNYWMELKYVDIMARQYALFQRVLEKKKQEYEEEKYGFESAQEAGEDIGGQNDGGTGPVDGGDVDVDLFEDEDEDEGNVFDDQVDPFFSLI